MPDLGVIIPKILSIIALGYFWNIYPSSKLEMGEFEFGGVIFSPHD